MPPRFSVAGIPFVSTHFYAIIRLIAPCVFRITSLKSKEFAVARCGPERIVVRRTQLAQMAC
jgi:hypothetical protein